MPGRCRAAVEPSRDYRPSSSVAAAAFSPLLASANARSLARPGLTTAPRRMPLRTRGATAARAPGSGGRRRDVGGPGQHQRVWPAERALRRAASGPQARTGAMRCAQALSQARAPDTQAPAAAASLSLRTEKARVPARRQQRDHAGGRGRSGRSDVRPPPPIPWRETAVLCGSANSASCARAWPVPRSLGTKSGRRLSS